MLATCVSGWLNCREYWMNACTSPSDSAPDATRSAADHGDQHVVQVADEHHGRLDRAGDELRPEAGLVQPLVVLGEGPHRLVALAEHLDQRVPGVHLLDVAVELAGGRPLLDELRLRPLADPGHGDRSRPAR